MGHHWGEVTNSLWKNCQLRFLCCLLKWLRLYHSLKTIFLRWKVTVSHFKPRCSPFCLLDFSAFRPLSEPNSCLQKLTGKVSDQLTTPLWSLSPWLPVRKRDYYSYLQVGISIGLAPFAPSWRDSEMSVQEDALENFSISKICFLCRSYLK